MRISYWSADVCSSYLGLDLLVERGESRIGHVHPSQTHLHRMCAVEVNPDRRSVPFCQQIRLGASRFDTGSAGQRKIFVERFYAVGDLLVRRRVVVGKSVSVRLDLGGRRYINKK